MKFDGFRFTELGYCVFAAALGFLVVPLYMIGQNPLDHHFIDFQAYFVSGLSLGSIFAVISGLFCLLLSAAKLQTLSRLVALFLVLWILVTGLLLPVSSSTGMIDPELNPINRINLVLSVAVVGLLVLACFTAAARYVAVFAGVVTLSTVVISLFSIFSADLSEADGESLVLSRGKNILVVSFDGLSGGTTAEVIDSHPEFARAFKDFVFYRNAVSQSPATLGSIMGELFGVRDFKSLGELQSDVERALVDAGLADELLLRRFEDSYQYNYRWGKKINIPLRAAMKKVETFNYFRYPLVRIWTRGILRVVNWERDLGPLRSHLFDQTANEDTDLLAGIQRGFGPAWDRKYNADLINFKTFVSSISSADKELSLRYLHFSFSHYPVDYDENCIFRGDDRTWFESNQNETGIKSQDECVFKMFIKLLEKLKALEIYDNSLIVFKSDHGKPVDYYSKYPRNLTINRSPKWGYDRYRPALMIKDFGASSETVRFESDLVLLNDLALTLCRKAAADSNCDDIPGLDLLGEAPNSSDAYYLYIAKDSDIMSFEFDDQISVRIESRNVSLLDAMTKSGLIELSEYNK